MPDDPDLPTQIVGRRRVLTRREKIVNAVVLAAAVALVAWQVANGVWSIVGLYVPLLGMNVALALRPPTTVDQSGIRRPWRRPSEVTWAEVASVCAPLPGMPGVQVRLTSGKTVSLLDIPATESAEVARIGGTTASRTTYTPTRIEPRAPSDRERAADIERRVQALSERGRQLDAEYRRIQRNP